MIRFGQLCSKKICSSVQNCALSSLTSSPLFPAVPVIITDAEDVIVLYTDTIHLNCSATGVRDPTYRYVRNVC